MADPSHIEEIEAQAALFALGALPPAEADEFSRRLTAGCPLCRAEVDDCNRALTAVLLATPRKTPPQSLRARVLEAAGKPAEERETAGILVRSEEVQWTPAPHPGVEVRLLRGRKTMLVRMAPDARIPAHAHSAAEQCLVLEGSVSSNGVTARAGDFTYMPAGSSHGELHSPEGALFLIAYT